MKLLATQRAIAAALMEPWNPRGRSSLAAARLIKPNGRLTSLDRLEIYSRSYWCRLLDSLREDFPGLAGILGAPAFERLAKAYLAQRPSQSYTMRDSGSRLEAWLREHPGHAGRNPALAVDMVRLEWAHIVAFDGPAEEPFAAGDLSELMPALRLGVQPYLSLLDVSYPVDRLRIAANGSGDGGCGEAAPRKGVPPRLRPEALFLAVHRLDHVVYYRRLRREEFRLLAALRAGRSISGAIRHAFRDSDAAGAEIPELLRAWFAAWAQLGWLTARRAAKGSRS
jgi:hypothetical protein